MDSKKFEVINSALLSIAALAVAASVVYRVFFTPALAPSVHNATDEPARRTSEWEDLRARATPVEGAGGRVVMLEVADFECPACRQFEVALQSMKAPNRAKIDLALLHLPLPYHRFAIPAAVAFECGARQGKAREIKEVLYAKQDSMGLLPWHDYAKQAGVGDSAMFATCLETRPDISKIESGVELARQLDLRGTPTIMVNGWILGRIPDAIELDRIVEAIDRGEDPTRRMPQ